MLPDARYTVSDRNQCHGSAIRKHAPNACHAVRDRHRSQIVTAFKHAIPDACHAGSDFNCLRFFYPITYIIIIQSGIDHCLLSYLA